MHPHKSVPAARVQRYALFLSGYDYKIEYKNTEVHSNADGLSCSMFNVHVQCKLPLVMEVLTVIFVSFLALK